MGAVRSQRLAQSGLSRSASITGVVAIPRNAVHRTAQARTFAHRLHCSNSSSISISITAWCAPRARWRRLLARSEPRCQPAILAGRAAAITARGSRARQSKNGVVTSQDRGEISGGAEWDRRDCGAVGFSVIASEAKESIAQRRRHGLLRRCAPRVDDLTIVLNPPASPSARPSSVPPRPARRRRRACPAAGPR